MFNIWQNDLLSCTGIRCFVISIIQSMKIALEGFLREYVKRDNASLNVRLLFPRASYGTILKTFLTTEDRPDMKMKWTSLCNNMGFHTLLHVNYTTISITHEFAKTLNNREMFVHCISVL